MGLLKDLLNQTEKIDFLFPNTFEELMNNEYYDYDKFEWFLYYTFKLDKTRVEKIGQKGKGDGGADLIIKLPQENGSLRLIGIQAKYWKNRVGVQPINQLASAKATHNLTDLWIITTSDLTSDAKKVAERMDIKILRANDVSRFIDRIKEIHKNNMEKTGESPIKFIQIKKELSQKIIKDKKNIIEENYNKESIEMLKSLRIELSKKYKLYPLYTVYNNKMLNEILEQKPITLEELSEIKGFGKKKVNTFGMDIIDFVKTNLLKNNNKKTNGDQELLDLLLKERTKIAKYNNITENDVYSDKVASYIMKMKPRTKEVLSKVYGFRKENIEIFGDYLIRLITNFLDSNK